MDSYIARPSLTRQSDTCGISSQGPIRAPPYRMEVRVRVISSRALWASLPRFTAGKKKMLVESDKLT